MRLKDVQLPDELAESNKAGMLRNKLRLHHAPAQGS